MSRRTVLIIYNLLLPLALLILLPKYLVRMVKRGGYSGAFFERFGIYQEGPRWFLECGKRVIWIHAVSVGEVNQLETVFLSLARIRPDYQFVISTTTATGCGRWSGCSPVCSPSSTSSD